jgi:hypothetical protein
MTDKRLTGVLVVVTWLCVAIRFDGGRREPGPGHDRPRIRVTPGKQINRLNVIHRIRYEGHAIVALCVV